MKSTLTQPVTYTGMIWILITQLMVMLPFTLYLPIWLIPVLLFTAGWRIRVLKGHTAQPGTPVKVILLALGITGLSFSGLQFPSLDLMVSILLLGFAFKTLEVIQQRDAIIVVFLGYFLVAVHFLYSQSMLAGLYGILSLAVLTAALIGVQHPLTFMSNRQSARHNLRLGAIMLLQCLPLMLIIFVFAPRLPPLFTLPLTTNQAKTGVSDHMAPGDIANLSQSDELAFRVTFKDKPPPQNQLYWRGLTLNHFDGRRWQQFAEDYGFRQLKQDFQSVYRWRPDNMRIEGKAIEYEAIYEKTNQPWLFTLTPSTEVYGEIMRGADYRVMATRELQSPTLLKAVSYPDSVRDLKLDDYTRRLTLQLPRQGNERTQQLAEKLLEQSATAQDYIDTVLARFRDEPYHYTLRPPLLGHHDTIDNFLFDSKRGFCAHYAGSFVYMMRAAGIPARVVAGYQGGEWNAAGKYMLVHQFDAHAWTEVWLEDKGWIRIDPTTMVAPSRTEQGLEAAMRTEGSFLENELFSTRKIAWMNNLRKQLDSVQYGWRRFVLGYDNEAQSEFLQGLFGQLTFKKMATILGSLLGVIGLFWMLILGFNRHKDKLPTEQMLYQKFCKALEKMGIQPETGQTPGNFARLAAERLPQHAGEILAINSCYEKLCYVPGTESERSRLLADMKRGIQRLT